MSRLQRMTPLSPERVWALAISLVAFSFYVGLLSKAYVFEGLIRAMPIETGRFAHLFPGNYLLYGPLGLLFHSFLHLLGIHSLAVTSLQLMDALLGAAGIYVFFLLLRRLGGDVLLCTVGCVVLGCSLGYWLWSTDAEDYILSTFLLLINFYGLVRYRTQRSKDPVLLGVLHGLAVLGHIVNIVFAPVVLWVLWSTHGKSWRDPAVKYAAAAGVVVGASYGLVIGVIQRPANAHDAWSWFLGSAGANDTAQVFVSSPSAAKLWTWLKMTRHIFISNRPEYANPPAWPFARYFLRGADVLLAIFVGVGGMLRRTLWRRHAMMIGACGIWLAAYACVFTNWEPQTLVYRVSDLVPLCTLLFLAIQSAAELGRAWRIAAVALAVCLAVGNFSSEVHPRSYASNNPRLARMAFLKANTKEGDWVTGDSYEDDIYIPYFAERRPILVVRFTPQPEQLGVFVNDLLNHRQRVYVTSRILDSTLWSGIFKQYRLSEAANDLKGFVIYRVSRSG